MTSLAAGAVCTKPTDCSAAKSCCQIWNTKADLTGTDSTLKACVADKAAAKSKITVTLSGALKTTDFDSCTSGSKTCDAYLKTACAGVAAGASTLAVSAAVAATAVYMM